MQEVAAFVAAVERHGEHRRIGVCAAFQQKLRQGVVLLPGKRAPQRRGVEDGVALGDFLATVHVYAGVQKLLGAGNRRSAAKRLPQSRKRDVVQRRSATRIGCLGLWLVSQCALQPLFV